MQVWDQVKVKKEDSEHVGRAGVVEKVDGTTVHVNLDETETHESGVEEFDEADLVFLGRGG